MYRSRIKTHHELSTFHKWPQCSLRCEILIHCYWIMDSYTIIPSIRMCKYVIEQRKSISFAVNPQFQTRATDGIDGETQCRILLKHLKTTMALDPCDLLKYYSIWKLAINTFFSRGTYFEYCYIVICDEIDWKCSTNDTDRFQLMISSFINTQPIWPASPDFMFSHFNSFMQKLLWDNFQWISFIKAPAICIIRLCCASVCICVTVAWNGQRLLQHNVYNVQEVTALTLTWICWDAVTLCIDGSFAPFWHSCKQHERKQCHYYQCGGI